MMHVIADSSCDVFDGAFNNESFDLTTVAFSMRLGDDEFLDDEQLDVKKFVDAMESHAEAGSSSCPSPHAWVERFNGLERAIALTISANLSGSFASAEAAQKLSLAENPEREIALIDSRATGPACLMVIEDISRWAAQGIPFDEICQRARCAIERTKTVFALNSFDNLIKNGRVSKLAGLVAKALKMWGIGVDSDGAITMKAKVKGRNRALKTILKDMEERGFAGLEAAITHCQNVEFANDLRSLILESYPKAKVFVGPTRGLDSFYAERGGVIVSYR